MKQADAGKMSVILVLDRDRLALEINDSGVGFDLAAFPIGTGLRNIRSLVERYGGTRSENLVSATDALSRS